MMIREIDRSALTMNEQGLVSQIDLEALDRVIATATTMRAYAVGAFDPKRRHKSTPAFVVSDPLRLASLRQALIVSPASRDSVMDVMTCGALDLCFLNGHDLITTVTYLGGGGRDMIRWSRWSGDIELDSADALANWLAASGWREAAGGL